MAAAEMCGVRRDHPRVCGENILRILEQTAGEGSPPRVRGKLPAGRARAVSRGITPACAGKTFSKSRSQRSWRDHPRVCGENYFPPPLLLHSLGSPPRVRGKHSVSVFVKRSPGITPACAGKTLGLIRLIERQRDHPRVCGENRSGRRKRRSQQGSPPRVRGKLACTCVSE